MDELGAIVAMIHHYECHNHTANIFNVFFTLFTCVPLSTVIPLYCLHLITAPSTVEKCKH